MPTPGQLQPNTTEYSYTNWGAMLDDAVSGVAHAVVEGAMGAGGAWVGARTGSAVGFAVGGVVGGPPGAAVGGVFGFVAGGIAGGIAGMEAGDITVNYATGKYTVYRSDMNGPDWSFTGRQDNGDSITWKYTNGGVVIHYTMPDKRAGLPDICNMVEVWDKPGRSSQIQGCNDVTIAHGGDGDDNMLGMGGNDRLYGDTGNDILRGGTHSDRLYGGTGNDRLYGGSGADKFYGGSGKDIFYTGGNDEVFDFDIADGDRVSTTGSERIVTGVQTTSSNKLLSVETASNDEYHLDPDHLPVGNDGWTLKEAQWFADEYIFLS